MDGQQIIVVSHDVNEALFRFVISADFFTAPPSSAGCINSVAVALVIFFMCSFAVAFAWWKWKRKKSVSHEIIYLFLCTFHKPLSMQQRLILISFLCAHRETQVSDGPRKRQRATP